MSFEDIDGVTLLTVASLMATVWLLSLLLRDASIVDVAWGVGFVAVAAVTFAVLGRAAPRPILLLVLTGLWGLRLSVHLLIRNWGAGEDPRYASMRRRWGKAFPLVSLGTVFVVQGAGMWVVSLPVQAGQIPRGALNPLDAIGVVVWIVGFAFESIGDLQLRRFKADPAHRGRVMDRGLWRYTRHPNYFGDAVQWWALGLIALAAGQAWTLVGPALMTLLLLRVSGVPLLERRMARTRPGYAEYARRTSAFVPMPPKRKEATT